MKFLLISFIIIPFLGWTSIAQATVVGPPTCLVKAEILEITQNTGSNQKFVTLKILSFQEIGPDGDCGFINVNQVIQTDGGSSAETLKAGELIEAGASHNVAMGPSGTIPFIQWQPIKLINASDRAVPLPNGFHLQSAEGKFSSMEQ